MIDEENEEDLLKNNITPKKVLKYILMISLGILGAIIIYIGIFPDNSFYNYILGISLMCIGTSMIQVNPEPNEPIKHTLTILKCSECNATKVRDHEDDDYIYKKKDNCNECNNIMVIEKIYSIKLKHDKKKKKEKKKQK